MKYFILILIILLPYNAFSNDSMIIEYGNIIVQGKGHENISIVNQSIQFNLHDFIENTYDVVVEYEYINKGEDEYLTIGFPIRLDGYSEEYKITKFKTVFNGIELLASETKKEDVDGKNIIWFIRKVLFKGHSITNSKISYTVPYSISGYGKFVNYLLGSAKSWNNKIGNLTIEISIPRNIMIGAWRIGDFNHNNPVDRIKIENNKFIISMDVFNLNTGQEDIVLYIDEFCFPNRYKGEFGTREQGWVWQEKYIDFGAWFTDYKYAKNEKRMLLLTKEQIQLWINCFYAFHGYKFINKNLNDYFMKNEHIFSGSDYSPDWRYHVNTEFDERLFNDVEKTNIEYLIELKKKLY